MRQKEDGKRREGKREKDLFKIDYKNFNVISLGINA